MGVYHDFKHERQSVSANFAVAPTSTFNVKGADPEETRYVAGFGMRLIHGENFSTDLEYNYNWQHDFHEQIGSIKVRYDF